MSGRQSTVAASNGSGVQKDNVKPIASKDSILGGFNLWKQNQERERTRLRAITSGKAPRLEPDSPEYMEYEEAATRQKRVLTEAAFQVGALCAFAQRAI